MRIPLSVLFVGTVLTGSVASGLPKPSIQAIIKSLQDSSVEVRTAAAHALGQAPDEVAARPLEAALIASADAAEQQALVAAIAATGDKGSIKRLMDALSNPQYTWGNGSKPKAVEAIAKLGEKDKKVLKWLTDLAAGEGEPAVRAAALRAMGEIGAPPKKEKS